MLDCSVAGSWSPLEPQYAPREVLLNVLATEGAPLSATEAIATAQEEAGSLATLVPRYLHAARQDADSRYRAAAINALGQDGGRSLATDPAWGAVVRRLFDAEGGGWEPARLLATVALKRELASADSVAEVLAWRIDAFLADNPDPPQPAGTSPGSALPDGGPTLVPACPAYESAAGARDRLTALAVTTLGGQLAGRARAEAGWPALIAALHRAENAGYSPADALTRVATARELRTARSISEVIAWRINGHLAAHLADADRPAITTNEMTVAPAAALSTAEDSITPPDAYDQTPTAQAATADYVSTPLLPWVPAPRQVPAGGRVAPLTAYLSDAAALISARRA